ncbi:MAG TPA: M1 family metallopeptidase [Gammaproteobacteria bacterium]|nr:M1 family metallopeptidase [Gammaproteobacteria bacterium]
MARGRLIAILFVGCAFASSGPVLAAAPDVSVRHYGLDITLDPASGRFTGSLSMEFSRTAADGGPLRLDMAAALKVETVVLDDQHTFFSHEADILAVQFPTGDAKAVHSLTITYSGADDRHGLRFSSGKGGRYVANFGMPYTAMHWWPCFDSPTFKAQSADIRITLPADMSAVSNGSLKDVKDLPGGLHRYHWSVAYPIYPDVVSIAAADYTRLDGEYAGLGGSHVLLQYYVFKGDAALAKSEFAAVPAVLKVYEELFGPYPFAKEKYGIAEVAIPSFREHQTIPSLGEGLMDGSSPVWDLGTVSNVIAHDMAHQWFGNSLTPSSWSDVWLNEGFSTYAVALWHERDGGEEAYRDFMRFLDTDDFSGSVYIKDEHDVSSEFTSTTFNKGAWVLHMLRHVMGDQGFFAALHDYATANRYGRVDTGRWLAACEQHYGKSLDWFFEEWIYGEGEPLFRTDWSQKDKILTLNIAQTQHGQAFTLPVDVEIHTDQGVTRQRVWLRQRMQSVDLPVQGMVQTVVLDPDGWVLKGASPQPGAA